MLRTWKHSCALLASFAIASTLWAGKEFPALPGQPVVPNQLLVRYKRGTPSTAVAFSLAPAGQAVTIATGLPDVYVVQLPAGNNSGFSTELSQNPDVEYVEPNRIRHTTVQPPNDPFIPPSMFSGQGQWALTTIQAQQAWQLLPNLYLTSATASAGRIKVAVIDTGADCTHPDFINTGGSSTDAAAASGGQLMFSLSHAFAVTTIASPTCTWQDDYGHGTHVSGTVAAATNNAVGVASLGYPLQLIEYKVLDHTGNGTDLDVANAIKMAADAGANVISMSLGGPGYSQTVQDAVNYAWQRNAVVVAAAGNNGDSSLFFPAGANNVIGVSATDIKRCESKLFELRAVRRYCRSRREHSIHGNDVPHHVGRIQLRVAFWHFHGDTTCRSLGWLNRYGHTESRIDGCRAAHPAVCRWRRRHGGEWRLGTEYGLRQNECLPGDFCRQSA